ncbi:hypothetical protein HBI56_233430 [Parastagonospora nodorum]|nr:hypothetical protein HBH56_114160 [Parastagonospora nodorum]QRD04939.1 hypothetical protein JI435_108590 [Parastagonospora nodorum SN15]KAH3928904.1 hypothetical protein HBH54_135000 [Parastagonospora nodorum]KAH3950458.1 hypothetical protein HBH53_075280 [Parastagonospora nodorum]KAH3965839.1 hypothetical protein HBH51_146480 [Parastagonospora nodorum]
MTMHSTPTPIFHHQPTQLNIRPQIQKAYAIFPGSFAYGAELDIENIQPGRAVTTPHSNQPMEQGIPLPERPVQTSKMILESTSTPPLLHCEAICTTPTYLRAPDWSLRISSPSYQS